MSDYTVLPPERKISWPPPPEGWQNLMAFQSVLAGKKVGVFWKEGCYDVGKDSFYEGTVERVLELAGEVWLLTGPEAGDGSEHILTRLADVDSFTIGERS